MTGAPPQSQSRAAQPNYTSSHNRFAFAKAYNLTTGRPLHYSVPELNHNPIMLWSIYVVVELAGHGA